jgi:hypothetical protein
MYLVWFVNVCVIATLVDQCLAVVGFAGLQAGGLVLGATCGLGSKYMFNAVPFVQQASDTERAKVGLSWVFNICLVLCITLGEA